jgi:hypothetical protein
MAIIAGQVPPPIPVAPALRRRVVVKLRPEVEVPPGGSGLDLAQRTGGAWDQLAAEFPGARVVPFFTALDAGTLGPTGAPAPAAGRPAGTDRFAGYLAIEAPAADTVEALARAVNAWPGVEIAYPEGGPTPPPMVMPGDDPRSGNQGYLDAAPTGIDARWAWGTTDGQGIGFVDLEQGWTLTHEDLSGAAITIISGVNQAYHGHGTAVLGEVAAVDNALGGVGIAPVATTRVVSQWRTTTAYNTAEAILSAAGAMQPGDVLLLEAQTTYPGTGGYLPVEVEQAVFDAIVTATSQGIVVVEAGANGSVDLDAFTDVNGKRILDRASADFRDSGAIMVGAASAAAPHARLSFSNFGTRIDCYAWGEQIDTCGDGWTGQSPTAYTGSFGGTSGASPIVTGAALLLQSWRKGRTTVPYSPVRLRQLLSDVNLNTPSATPATDRIGVLPNLRGIVESEAFADVINSRRWWAVVWILFGVTNDGGGLVWRPGRGPGPVDPWGPLRHLAPEKRDVLAGLAATELAELFEHGASKAEMTRAGVSAMRRALDGIGRHPG